MIIKKKYTTIKKITEEPTIIEEPIVVEETVSNEQLEPIEKQNTSDAELQLKQSEEETVEKKKKSIQDLDLSLENIKFEQREERREGTRRRGYRRTQDRNIVSRAQKDALSIKEVAKKEGYEEGIASAQKDLEDLKSKFTEFFNYKDEVFAKVSDCIFDEHFLFPQVCPYQYK